MNVNDNNNNDKYREWSDILGTLVSGIDGTSVRKVFDRVLSMSSCDKRHFTYRWVIFNQREGENRDVSSVYKDWIGSFDPPTYK